MLLGLFSCTGEIDLEFPEVEPRIVVDGWIESGSYPRVIITRSAPYFEKIDSATYRDLVITRAKVSVIHEKQHEVLTLDKDTMYFPPYIYKGVELAGEAGETYMLKIEYQGEIYTAETTIPEVPDIDSIWFDQEGTKTELGKIIVRFTDNPREKNYYRFFSQVVDTQYRFYPTYVSTIRDLDFNGQTLDFPVFKGPEGQIDKTGDIHFERGETVRLKICTMDSASFMFWKSVEFEKTNAINPFAASSRNLAGNISSAFGIWCGYGVYRLQIRIPYQDKKDGLAN